MKKILNKLLPLITMVAMNSIGNAAHIKEFADYRSVGGELHRYEHDSITGDITKIDGKDITGELADLRKKLGANSVFSADKKFNALEGIIKQTNKACLTSPGLLNGIIDNIAENWLVDQVHALPESVLTTDEKNKYFSTHHISNVIDSLSLIGTTKATDLIPNMEKRIKDIKSLPSDKLEENLWNIVEDAFQESNTIFHSLTPEQRKGLNHDTVSKPQIEAVHNKKEDGAANTAPETNREVAPKEQQTKEQDVKIKLPDPVRTKVETSTKRPISVPVKKTHQNNVQQLPAPKVSPTISPKSVLKATVPSPKMAVSAPKKNISQKKIVVSQNKTPKLQVRANTIKGRKVRSLSLGKPAKK